MVGRDLGKGCGCLTVSRAGGVLRGAVSHTQSSHQGLMIRERGATVRIMAYSGSKSLTGDVEPGNCLGKVRAREKHTEGLFPFLSHQRSKTRQGGQKISTSW